MVNTEKIINSLKRKFSKRSEFEDRKIVFWYDSDQVVWDILERRLTEDMETIIDVLKEDNIKFIHLDNNNFEIKKLIEMDDKNSDYLIYSNTKQPLWRDNWLLDIVEYSETFDVSRISDIKSEFDIDTYDLDDFLKKYQKFFENKVRVQYLKKFYSRDWREKDFIIGFLNFFTKSQTIDIHEVLRNVLMASIYEDENPVWKEIENYGIENDFWELIETTYGLKPSLRTLEKLYLSFIITHISKNSQIKLRNYTKYVNTSMSESEIFIRNWMTNRKDSEKFVKIHYMIMENNDHEIERDLTSLFSNIDIDCLLEIESTDVIDKVIIRKIKNDLEDNTELHEKYLEWIERRKTKFWFSKFENIYEALKASILFFKTVDEFERDDLNTLSEKDLFGIYTKKYFQIDTYYRKFYYYFDMEAEKEILKGKLEELVRKRYSLDYLEPLLMRWTDLLEKDVIGNYYIDLIERQDSFFDTYIKRTISKNDRSCIVVIISDGLRYEVAQELKDIINERNLGTASTGSMLGILPSYTKLGMASFLPHKCITLDKSNILLDGNRTASRTDRESILKNKVDESITFDYRDIYSMKTHDARELIKGKRIIYIYHNKIDHTGDKQNTEHEVFTACEQTIDHLEKLVSRLTRSLNLNNILITADHGFLYSRQELEPIDKLKPENVVKTNIIDSNKRFILTEDDLDLENSIKINMDYILNQEGIMCYMPKADLRFVSPGGGVNYVHGGASLQEIVIPVIHYQHIKEEKILDRKGIKYGKVGLNVIEKGRKITGNTVVLRILQTEKVTDKKKPVTASISLWDLEGEKTRVSDEKKVIFDSKSDVPQEREVKVTLNLRSGIPNKIYYLRIMDVDESSIKEDIIDPVPYEVDIMIIDDF